MAHREGVSSHEAGAVKPWEQARRLFEEAVQLPAEERATYLDAHCPAPELRGKVESLLRADAAGGRFLESSFRGEFAAPREIGDFELGEELGRGGSSVVFKAVQRSLQRQVAVKVLHQTVATEADETRRFHDESVRLAMLAHPNIVQVHVGGVHARHAWFAMELVPGTSLDQVFLAFRARKEPPVPFPAPSARGYVHTVATVCATVAAALQHAHDQGVVHCDIKPSNILITPSLGVKVADFGVGIDRRRSGERTPAGSLRYMSPEQAVGSPPLDARTDVYSLGAVLYELLTLQPPHAQVAENKLLDAVRACRLISVRRLNPAVPRDLEMVCGKAMAAAPEDRYSCASAVAEDLGRFLDYRPVAAAPPSVWRRLRYVLRRYRVLFAVTLLLSAAVGFGVWLQKGAAATEAASRLMRVVQDCPNDRAALAGTDPHRLAGIRRAAEELVDRAVSEPERLAAHATLRALQAHCEELVGGATSTMNAAHSALQQGRVAALDVAAVLSAQEDGRRAALIQDDPAIMHRLAAGDLLPSLTVQAESELGPAAVSYHPLDPITGQPLDARVLGDVPLRLDRLSPGPARIVVHFASGLSLEYTRFVLVGAPSLEIRCRKPSRASRTTPLITIAPGTVRPPNEGLPWAPLAGRTLDVPAYEIEQYEVTVGQFREFLAAKPGRYISDGLRLLLDHSDAQDKPVTCITWEDARDYAEWLGLRLPSYVEMTCATRGPQWKVWPFVGDDAAQSGNVSGPKVDWNRVAILERVAIYLRHVQPYDQPPTAASVDGVHHLAGNVAEWVEGPAPDKGERGLIPRGDTRLVMNGDWSVVERRKLPHTDIESRGPGPAWAFITHGFRCARTRR